MNSRRWHVLRRGLGFVPTASFAIIFKALKAKVEQLTSAPEGAVRLIILCDGNCGTMRSRLGSSMSFSARAIAEDFLRQNRSIDLVLLVSVTRSGYDSHKKELHLRCELVTARSGGHLTRLNSSALETVRLALDRAAATLPQPVLEPINAARLSGKRIWPWVGRSLHDHQNSQDLFASSP